MKKINKRKRRSCDKKKVSQKKMSKKYSNMNIK